MTLRRWLLAFVAVTALAGAAYVSQDAEPTGSRMAGAAETFVAGLKPDQKSVALYDFDSKERTNWHFVPWQKDKKALRKGLRIGDMTAEQKEAAMQLLKVSAGAVGYGRATTIMSLENVLADLEKNGPNVRDPGWYFFTIFGTPSKTGSWGFRVEGHHLSLNFTLDRGRLVGVTPYFFGANPADIKEGSRKGLHPLPECDDLARKFFDALDADQQKVARQSAQFPEIEEATTAVKIGTPVGLAAAKMSAAQKELLMKLVEAYTARMPAEIGVAELQRIKDAGVDKVHFALAKEDDKPGKPHTYRVHGPTFVIEFLNVQADSAGNPANHIHSVWHDLPQDFGAPAK